MIRSIAAVTAVLAATLSLLPAAARAGDDHLAAALADAKLKKSPLLVDFRAPWCYSCYYMAKNVLNGPEWEQVQKKAVFVDVDADSPEGAATKQSMSVTMLPAYVVLDDEGREIGRILGEQTRKDFYHQLDAILSKGKTLDELQKKAAEPGAKGLEATRETLELYRRRADADGGLAWYTSLPKDTQVAYDKVPGVQRGLARLKLLKAKNSGDAPGCAAAAPAALSDNKGCDRAYELDALLQCTAGGKLPNDQRVALLKPQRKPMESLVEQHVFVPKARCADERSAVFALADLEEALGDPAAAKAVKVKAAEDLSKRIKDDLGADRNKADNLRAYYEHTEDWAHYDALMPKLAATWPDDYVYPYRFGKNLLARGKAAEALPWLERAAPKAYGANRLQVAGQQAAALKALGRDDDAKHVIADALKANGPWFPDEAAKLKAML